MKDSLCLGAVLALVACGGGGGNPDGGNPDAGSMDAGSTTATTTGAHPGTYTTGPQQAVWTVSADNTQVTAEIDNGTDDVRWGFVFAGKPTTASYVGSPDAGIDCVILVSVTATLDGWLAAYEDAAFPNMGACSLTLTSVVESADVTTQKKYAVHGSIAGTLPARSGAAMGTTTFSASF